MTNGSKVTVKAMKGLAASDIVLKALGLLLLTAVLSLGLFRPPSAFSPLLSFLRSLPPARIRVRECIRNVFTESAKPLPSWPHFAVTAALGAAILGLTTPIAMFLSGSQVCETWEQSVPDLRTVLGISQKSRVLSGEAYS
jgi:hypothetical protein